MASIPPLVFTGVSDFSNDFQTVLDRAVKIAEIPLKQMQNHATDVLQRKSLFGGLASAVNAMSTSLSSLGDIAENRALAASSSDTSKVTVTLGGATSAASYTINSITSAATAASERTQNHYADAGATAVSSNGSLRLKIGSDDYDFTLTTNTLVGLRDKINSLGAGVNASILTTGDGNYLTLSSSSTGAKTLQLIDDPTGAATNLLTSSNQGTNAVFQLNGIPVEQAGNVVNSVIPGLTFTIQDASATPVTLTLATDRTKLSSALQDFVANYNAVRQQVSAQMGPNAGMLTGNNIISQLAGKLRQMVSYQAPSGDIRNLTDVGISFSSAGEASFDSKVFSGLTDAQVDAAFTFVGSVRSGLGGYSASMSEIADPVTGLIRAEQDGLDRIDKRLQDQMDKLGERITIMQNALAAKLQIADSLLAQLASQQKQLGASLQGLSLTLYGKNQG